MTRKNPLLFERDGSLNLTWALVTVYCLAGLGLTAVAVVVAIRLNSWVPVLAAFVFCALCIVMLLIAALPLNKAKVLADSRVVAQGLESLGAIREAGSTEPWDSGQPFDYLARRVDPRPEP